MVQCPTIDLSSVSESASPSWLKLCAALAYGICSLLIVFANKLVLTVFEFPSFRFVALSQYVATVCVLSVQKHVDAARQRRQHAQQQQLEAVVVAPTGHGGSASPPPQGSGSGNASPVVKPLYPDMSMAVLRAVFPLPLIFFGNTVSGLGATQHLNMPMFVLLRRFSIVMTMGLEVYLLEKSFPRAVQLSVLMMVVGAVIAASDDLQMDLVGYALILTNDVFTAAQGVVLRWKLDLGQSRSEAEAGKRDGRGPSASGAAMSAHSMMFYNSLVSIPLAASLWFAAPGEVSAVWHFQRWAHPGFLVCYGMSMALGFVLNYTYVLCTKVNSPLTTTVVGSLKNVLSSYLGMLIKDYKYSFVNFLGVNVSVAATLVYSWAEMRKVREISRTQQSKQRQADEDSVRDAKKQQQRHEGAKGQHSRSTSIVAASPATAPSPVTPALNVVRGAGTSTAV